jgi:hypothetical protein
MSFKNTRLAKPKVKKISLKSKKQLVKGKDFAKLNALAHKIRDGHEAVEKCIKGAKEKARLAVTEAIITGEALTEVKRILGFGRYGRWLKEHCKQISERTCQNYMSLYNSLGRNTKHVAELPITNLRKAYLMLGIINEPIDDPQPITQVEAPPRKQLTNGDSGNPVERVVVETDAPVLPLPKHGDIHTQSSTSQSSHVVDAEIVHAPQQSPKQRLIEQIKSRQHEHHIYLFNILKEEQMTAEELSAITLDPMLQFFTANYKHLTAP